MSNVSKTIGGTDMDIKIIKKDLAAATAHLEAADLLRKKADRLIRENDGWGTKEASEAEADSDAQLLEAYRKIRKSAEVMEEWFDECNVPRED